VDLTLNSASPSACGLLFAWVLAEQAGLPIPAVPMLLASQAFPPAAKSSNDFAAGFEE